MKNHMVRSNPVICTEAGGRPRKCLFSLQCSGMLLSGDPGGRPSRQFPDEGGPAWPKTTCIPERFSGQRWVSDPGDGQEKPRGPSGVQGWAPRLRQAGSCTFPGRCLRDAGDADVKVCMLIVRERKQDSCCSKPKSHGEFDVRIWSKTTFLTKNAFPQNNKSVDSPASRAV